MDEIARLRRLVIGLTIAVFVLGALQLLSLFHKPQRVHMASLTVDTIMVGRENEMQTVIQPGEITLSHQTSNAKISVLDGATVQLAAGSAQAEMQVAAAGGRLSIANAKPATRAFLLSLDKDKTELNMLRPNAMAILNLNDTTSAFRLTGQVSGQPAFATLSVASESEKTGLRIGDPSGIANLAPGALAVPLPIQPAENASPNGGATQTQRPN